MSTAAPAGTRRTELRHSARSGAIGLAGAAVSGLFGFLLAVVITRGYGATGAGGLFAAIGVLTVATAICCLGADTALIWALPRRRLGPGGDGARLLPVALLPPLTVAVLVALAGMVTARLVAPHLLAEAGRDGARLLAVTFAAVPMTVAMTVLLSAVRASRPIGAYVGIQFLLLPIGRPVLVALAAVLGGGLVAGLLAWWAPVLAAVFGCVLLAWRPLGVGAAALRASADDWRTFWGFALPRALSAAIDSGSMWIGVLLTAALAGQRDAGIFGGVGRYVLAGQLAMQGLRVAVAPQLARLLGADRRDDALAVHRQTTVWVVLLSWPVYLLLAAFAPAFLALFGREFSDGAAALAVLAAAMLVNVGLGNVQTLLLMSGRSGRHLLAATLGLATTLLLGLLLIPPLGVLGTALGWAAGIVVENVVAATAASAVLGRSVLGRSVLATAGGTLAVVGAAAAAGMALTGGLSGGRGPAGLAVALGLLAVGAAAALTRPAVRSRLTTAVRTLRGAGPGTGADADAGTDLGTGTDGTDAGSRRYEDDEDKERRP
ncbi:lipopolysaccharide biosynthesis protein [Plantactinospora sp. KBS50]|uniref:lipopolysaccharide biosynthesis protein n=1 Tax=Plantactinospora sp. KBS50 TaxID=2024580 RepID=UPI0018E04C36|nr:lipopolysaccharide biosynthesis protein [Plantactinospora sp. KBS50]